MCDLNVECVCCWYAHAGKFENLAADTRIISTPPPSSSSASASTNQHPASHYSFNPAKLLTSQQPHSNLKIKETRKTRKLTFLPPIPHNPQPMQSPSHRKLVRHIPRHHRRRWGLPGGHSRRLVEGLWVLGLWRCSEVCPREQQIYQTRRLARRDAGGCSCFSGPCI
jgi:hypothetical protein